ncbi:MAG TPA: hypothetical protein VGK10_20655 [Prolixibacteraceae bacterium]|jgi:hypothetical protein
MKPLIKIALILSIAFISGCYYDSEERLYPNVSNPCDDTVVTFSGTVTQILQPCLQCHSNAAVSHGEGGGIRLENHDDVASNTRVMGSVKQENGYIKMPKNGGKLIDCEISQLQKWYDNQTPNN